MFIIYNAITYYIISNPLYLWDIYISYILFHISERWRKYSYSRHHDAFQKDSFPWCHETIIGTWINKTNFLLASWSLLLLSPCYLFTSSLSPHYQHSPYTLRLSSFVCTSCQISPVCITPAKVSCSAANWKISRCILLVWWIDPFKDGRMTIWYHSNVHDDDDDNSWWGPDCFPPVHHRNYGLNEN